MHRKTRPPQKLQYSGAALIKLSKSTEALNHQELSLSRSKDVLIRARTATVDLSINIKLSVNYFAFRFIIFKEKKRPASQM